MKPTFKNRPHTLHNINGREIWESRSPAIVGLIFAMTADELYVLAEKRSQKMPDAPGKWCLPCGYMDWDENGWNALRREIYEETSFYIDAYKKYLMDDNGKEPFFVNTEPSENRQNIALIYYLIYDFNNIGLPKDVETYKDSEIEKIKWLRVDSINKYDWAFEHDKRIKQVLNKIESDF